MEKEDLEPSVIISYFFWAYTAASLQMQLVSRPHHPALKHFILKVTTTELTAITIKRGFVNADLIKLQTWNVFFQSPCHFLPGVYNQILWQNYILQKNLYAF